MPNVIDDSKEAQDERYNPSTARDLRARENGAFNDIANNYDQTADDTQENANIAAAREGEATSPAVSAGWQSNVTGKSAEPSKPKFFSKAFWTKGNLKKKRATLADYFTRPHRRYWRNNYLTPWSGYCSF